MVTQDKSKKFAVRIIRFCKFLTDEKHEYILAKQVLKSGTAIGANLAEASHAQSRRDFLSKINIALKECSETKYWLEILCEAEINPNRIRIVALRLLRNRKLLTSAVKTTKASL